MLQFHIHGMGEFDAAHRIGPCAWADFDLLAVHSGRVWIELMRRDRVELSAGQAILIYPHTYFTGESIAPLSRASVQHFALRRGGAEATWPHPLRRLLGCRGGYERYPAKMSAALADDIRRAIALAHAPPPPALGHSMRAALLTLILGQLLLENGGSNAKPPVAQAGATIDLTSVIEWMTARHDTPPTLKGTAAFAGVSPSHFRAVFARQVGQSPGRFLRQARHVESARLLRETRIPIKQIARSMGYDDLAHFYRFFTRTMSMTPGEYRRKYRLRG